MDITSLELGYRHGDLSPVEMIRHVYAQIRQQGEQPVWISLVPEEDSVARAKELEVVSDRSMLPLYGIPFAVKDNFDVAGMQTTAACPAYGRVASDTATAVERLLKAGAILIGKTNMDQFATGLVGTRSPYGICSSTFNPKYISGGSSSGSAVAVALGQVSFSLGTDTAGSGRVPAAFNQLVGLKPTRGLVSTRGLLPACRTLDCVSIFAETCGDAARVLDVLRGIDTNDSYTRSARPGEGAAPWVASTFQFGVPTDESIEFFGDDVAGANYAAAVVALEQLGGKKVLFDYGVFQTCAQLLYGGPWVAERLASLKEFVAGHAADMDPTVAQIIGSAAACSAGRCF